MYTALKIIIVPLNILSSVVAPEMFHQTMISAILLRIC